ncbi:MAG: hypothetical protein OQL19_15020 [Gammaproteobacteria bacterium]|nr:hypothetical protein [Gammaproteobacteria bacterium]
MSIKTIFVLAVLLISNLAFAGSGKAINPHWSGDISTSASTIIYVSNITDNNINLTITFYGDDGTVVPITSYTNIINGNTQLAPNSTGEVQIKPSTRKTGYAVIEWENESTDDNVVALVAHALRISVNTSSRRADITIPINNGMPF